MHIMQAQSRTYIFSNHAQFSNAKFSILLFFFVTEDDELPLKSKNKRNGKKDP